MDKRLSSFLSTVASVAMAFLIWGLVLAISNSNPQPLDVTKNARFTLAAQSRQAVLNLPAPVKVYAFVSEREKAKPEELLKRYAKIDNKKFTFEVLDPRKNPVKAKKYQIRFAGEGVVELQDKESQGRTERLSSIAEEDVTGALLKLQRNKSYKVYFTSGHGERDLNQSDGRGLTQLKGDLSKEGFTVDTLSLASSPKIPDDADMIVCAGPTKPLLPGEQKLLQDYLAGYGRFMMLYEPETPASYGDLIKPYGVEVSEEIVLDQASQMLGAEPSFAVGLVYDQGHSITKDYKMQTMFELARPVKLASPPPSGVTVTKLVTTSDRPETALIVPLSEVLGKDTLKLDPSKLKPSLVTLAAASVKKEEAPKATPTPAPDKATTVKELRLVTVGDSDLLSNGTSLKLYQINKDFVLNSFNWLAANETQISIRPKDELSAPLNMSGGEQSKMMFLLAFLMPGMLIGLGIFNVMRRQ
jgi:ABC-type uncharacterized transport system involved in gliding motility auxiliary subunit